MPLYSFDDKIPVLGKRVYVADTASLIGDVKLDDDVSVWPSSVLRGDMYSIEVGAKTNIQDGCVIHVTMGLAKTTIGQNVVVGHMVLLHGCTIGDRCLIGMGSLIMDNVIIEDECVIAAGTLIPPNTRIPKRSMVMGRPGKVTRALEDSELGFFVDAGVSVYLDYKNAFLSERVKQL